MTDNFRKYNIRMARKLNQDKDCIYHPGKKRVYVSRYCQTCFNRFHRTGSAKPGSRLYHLKFYQVTASETFEIIRINRKSLLIAEAIGFIDRMFYRAARGVSIPGFNRKAQRYIKNCGVHEPDAAEVLSYLVAANALYFSKHNPYTDHENYLRNLSHIVIRWVRGANPTNLQPTAHRQIARYIDKRLGATLRKIAEAWEKRELEKRERQKMLRAPFKLFDGDENQDFEEKLNARRNKIKRMVM